MKILNKAQVDELFRREALLIEQRDVVPEYSAEALFGTEAVAFAKHTGGPGRAFNEFGIGNESPPYLTYMGFQIAASFYNVRTLRQNDAGQEQRPHTQPADQSV